MKRHEHVWLFRNKGKITVFCTCCKIFDTYHMPIPSNPWKCPLHGGSNCSQYDIGREYDNNKSEIISTSQQCKAKEILNCKHDCDVCVIIYTKKQLTQKGLL